MFRFIFWLGVLTVVLLAFVATPEFFLVAKTMLGSKDKAWFATEAQMGEGEVIHALAGDIAGGTLGQSRDYETAFSMPLLPGFFVGDRGSGLALSIMGERRGGGDLLYAFSTLYMPSDPGDEPVTLRFRDGQTPDGALLIYGYVNDTSHDRVYGVPVSGTVRLEKTGAESYRADFDVAYRCGRRTEGPGRWAEWKPSPDCQTDLFSDSIRYGPQPKAWTPPGR